MSDSHEVYKRGFTPVSQTLNTKLFPAYCVLFDDELNNPPAMWQCTDIFSFTKVFTDIQKVITML